MSFPLIPRQWAVTTTDGRRRTTHLLEATTATTAIQSALELAGPGARLVACVRGEKW